MNIYDYRTIPPEESAYHARISHGSGEEETSQNLKSEKESSSSDIKSSDFGAEPAVKDIIPDEVRRRDGPGGN